MSVKASTITRQIKWEEDGLPREQEIAHMQDLIDSGMAWKLQGSVGRECMQAIEVGDCILGPEATRDAHGNRVPSRTDVQSGTKGSVAYQAARQRACNTV